MLIVMRFMLHRFNIYTLCYMAMKICKLGDLNLIVQNGWLASASTSRQSSASGSQAVRLCGCVVVYMVQVYVKILEKMKRLTIHVQSINKIESTRNPPVHRQRRLPN